MQNDLCGGFFIEKHDETSIKTMLYPVTVTEYNRYNFTNSVKVHQPEIFSARWSSLKSKFMLDLMKTISPTQSIRHRVDCDDEQEIPPVCSKNVNKSFFFLSAFHLLFLKKVSSTCAKR